MHTIRLRGPWELQPLSRCAGPPAVLPPAGRVEVPGDWAAHLGEDFRGTARYTRRFNRPTNLASDERVWLVFAEIAGQAAIELNATPLAKSTEGPFPRRFDITDQLAPHNTLVVEVSRSADSAPGPGGLIGEVRLEIGSSG